MIKRVCDLCEKNPPDAKIKYKYRAKRSWWAFDTGGWYRIELCEECLEKLIKVHREFENMGDL